MGFLTSDQCCVVRSVVSGAVTVVFRSLVSLLEGVSYDITVKRSPQEQSSVRGGTIRALQELHQGFAPI